MFNRPPVPANCTPHPFLVRPGLRNGTLRHGEFRKQKKKIEKPPKNRIWGVLGTSGPKLHTRIFSLKNPPKLFCLQKQKLPLKQNKTLNKNKPFDALTTKTSNRKIPKQFYQNFRKFPKIHKNGQISTLSKTTFAHDFCYPADPENYRALIYRLASCWGLYPQKPSKCPKFH